MTFGYKAVWKHKLRSRAKTGIMQRAVCRRFRHNSCLKHFHQVFEYWRQLAASYVSDYYHLESPFDLFVLGRGDVVVDVGTAYIVKKARCSILGTVFHIRQGVSY